MSTIDQPKIIAELLRKGGRDRLEGANIMHTTRESIQATCSGCGEKHIDMGTKVETKQKRLLLGPRHTSETILEYTTGYGGKAWKLLYGMYPNGMNTWQAEAIFRATANLKPGAEIKTLLLNGELTEAGKQFLQDHPL